MARQVSRLVTGEEIENLPSFGMSNYLNIENGAEAMEMIKNIGAGKSPTWRTRKLTNTSHPATSSGEQQTCVQVIVQDDTGSEQASNESATAPIASTVDASQIMETEPSSTQDMAARPELKVKLTTNYMRFRYMSEKCPKKKGHKTRAYESEDADKHCLAEVWIENYEGVGKIVAYCVDSVGKLHPYNLFGDGCHRGIYVQKFKFRKGRIARLNKVSVTTPKAKEYKGNLQNQLSYLSEAGIDDVKFCNEDIQDKQIVYIMFRVILDDHSGEILSKISTPLQNKKKGKEFLIEDVEPVSCPANITSSNNPLKHRVMLHVTEGTAFPSEVGIKVRERDSSTNVIWEAEPDEIRTIKQCVVKFVPPPYRIPDTKRDVEVEICLYDKVTKNETEPFKFTYIGSDNVTPEMNIGNKAKKRKLTEDIDLSSLEFVPDVRGEKHVLSQLPQPCSSGSDNIAGSAADNTMSYQETQSIQMYATDVQNQSNLKPTGEEDEGVSVRQSQQVNGQLPFQNYASQKHGDSIFGSNSPQSVNQSQYPELTGQMSGRNGVQASSNQSSVVTSTTSVFCTTTQTSNQNVSSNMTAMSVNSNRRNTPNHQQETGSEEQLGQMMFLSEADQLTFQQQGVQLPKLGPNQMLAVIGGQVYVVNDDVSGQTPNPPSTEQNIGQHVVVQHFPPQQPASEAEQRQTTLQPNAIQGSPQVQTISGVTQSGSNPLAALSSNAGVNQQQQQNMLLHQQMLQQQQQGVQQQQQVLQQLAMVATAAGLDINEPGVLQALLQGLYQIQGQTAMPQGYLTNNGAGASVTAAGADLNDDDLEEDGDKASGRNTFVNSTNKPSTSSNRNSKLKASSDKGKRLYEEEEMEYVEGQVDEDSRIPVFVNEVTVGEDSNDSEHYNKVQSQKVMHFKHGSFGNDISSDDDGESR